MATKNDKGLKRAEPKPTAIHWWDAAQLDLKGYSPASRMFLNYAVANHLTVWSGRCRGVMVEEQDEQAQEKFYSEIVALTGATSPFADVPIFGRGKSETWFTWPEGCLQVEVGLDGKYDIAMLTVNQSAYEEIAKLLGDFLLPEFVRQPIYSLALGANGVEISEIGPAGVPFERDNYEADVVESFEYISDDLQRANPMGRLSIIQGEPGTGKTFFIKGLLYEVYDAVFVLIPPSMVEDLAGPKLVPTLIRARSMIGLEKPIVLLIEDADKALVPRVSVKRVNAFNEAFAAMEEAIHGMGLPDEQREQLLAKAESVRKVSSQVGENNDNNLAAISALLNASDGILGTALNLRIICTTNAKVDEIDDALMRPGRLSKQVYIGPLSVEKAKEVYNRISEGEDAEFNSDMTLSQVYDFYKYMDNEQDKEEEEEGDDEVPPEEEEEEGGGGEDDEDEEESDEEDEEGWDEDEDEEDED